MHVTKVAQEFRFAPVSGGFSKNFFLGFIWFPFFVALCMIEAEHYLRALERLMRAVKAAGAHDHPEIMTAYRACVNQLGYEPSKRYSQAISQVPPSGFMGSSTASVPGDFFYLLNPEE